MSEQVTTTQFAKDLGLAEITVRVSRATGVLCGQPAPKFLKLGRKVFYTREAVEKFKASIPCYSSTAEAKMAKGV